MGHNKQMMLEHQSDLAEATDYLVYRGLLQECPYHGFVYEADYLEPDFWASAMADRKRGTNGPIPWAADVGGREFTDLLKRSYEDHSADECPYCAKHEME